MRVWNKKTQKGRQIDLEVFSYILRNGVNICSYRERVMQKRLTPNDAETPEDWMKLAHAAKRRAAFTESLKPDVSRHCRLQERQYSENAGAREGSNVHLFP